ncbi:MAG: excinuclease ABC subunit UvrA [Bacteroidales bacterium]|nr:excinuclease ABC subunit UvrA [Bacteroidales bacterium]
MNERNSIIIKGARVHNLKNIDIKIPRGKFIVITGLSGSGKSSLAFDTLYAEGQRRYVESLSAYARQFLGRINKPDVDYIKGIPPAIAIEQKVNTKNPRSTVGTSTEIYDYLKLLFARIGKTYSPVSGKLVKKHSVTDVVNYILSQGQGNKALILAPFSSINKTIYEGLEILIKQGFSRIEINNEIIRIEEYINSNKISVKNKINVVIDRITISDDEDTLSRIADSVQTAFFESNGECIIKVNNNNKLYEQKFSNRFEADGLKFEVPNVHMFSFNNPVGACIKCEGYGSIIGINENLVIPNKNLSVYEGTIVCWKGEKMGKWNQNLILNANKFDFPIHKPYYELTSEQKDLLWTGNQYFKGLNAFFNYVEKKSYKIQYRVMLSRYRGKTTCPECKGTRLQEKVSYVKIDGKSIRELVLLSIIELQKFFKNISLNKTDKTIAKRLLIEINYRLQYLVEVGLGYLTLNRLSSTLSGGESQRINIATSLGSSLVGSLYILDEPSIGLHSRDTKLLIKVLKNLQNLSNTVLVVEHDEEIIKSADEIIDIGPLAGIHGGEIVFQGKPDSLLEENNSLTKQYLTGIKEIKVPDLRRKWSNYIEVKGVCENNLKNINVKFPLNIITVVSGVSGSGKSSLVKNILFPALTKSLDKYYNKNANANFIEGDIELVLNVEFIDQNPIGRSSRSNPVTYIKAYDEIRKLFASQQLAKYYGFSPSHFSFNIDGGRCEECQGEGLIRVEMQFMADVELVCENCKGKRFKDDVLEIQYKDKNIFDILELTVNEAIGLFGENSSSIENKIVNKLKPLANVGLGYIKLGQSSSTLSGGESQRVKLATFLGKEKEKQHTVFIFDEPTTGLHFHDIKVLLKAFNELIKRGNTIIIIEHNLEIIKSADWIIDLGPEGGDNGGYVIFEGTPEDLISCQKSYTAQYLAAKFN